MALDEALMLSSARGISPPCLRLYAWQPACLSLGQAQPIGEVDRDALARRGWEVVRRPTGGRAILHTDELTYSVCAPADDPVVAGSVLESYCRLAGALLASLELMELTARADASYNLASTQSPQGPVCFEVPSNYEITARGKKLIGSAQFRQQGGVLQHGSLPLCGDLTRILQVLYFTSDEERAAAANRLLDHATTVETLTGKRISWKRTAMAISRGFSRSLGLQLRPAQPTPAEISLASELQAAKYAHPSWTNRR